MIRVDSNFAEIERAAKLSQMSTMIVYEKHRKNAIGYVSLIEMRLRDQQSIEQVCALPKFVATYQLTEALVEMRENRSPVAGVTNTRGQVIGVVYYDDLVQSIMT